MTLSVDRTGLARLDDGYSTGGLVDSPEVPTLGVVLRPKMVSA